jgi:large subunit ribosomal protein L18
MKAKATYRVKRRRRRKQKTNYKKRLAAIKSGKPRFVVRGSNNHFTAQIMNYREEGDITACFAHSNELKKKGFSGHCGNITAAYLTGYLCAKKALKNKITEAILDIGLATPIKASRAFSALKGAIDAGLKIEANEKVFPSEERIKGQHLKKKIEFEKVVGEINKQFK